MRILFCFTALAGLCKARDIPWPTTRFTEYTSLLEAQQFAAVWGLGYSKYES
jgi:hypothetical protein